MAIEPFPLNSITRVVNDDGTGTAELIKVIQQLLLVIADHEARIEALEP